jgi:hypothetical protein
VLEEEKLLPGTKVGPSDDVKVLSSNVIGGMYPMDAQMASAFLRRSTVWSTFAMVASSAFNVFAFISVVEMPMQ